MLMTAMKFPRGRKYNYKSEIWKISLKTTVHHYAYTTDTVDDEQRSDIILFFFKLQIPSLLTTNVLYPAST